MGLLASGVAVQQRRDYATRFQPGSTPNPGGRPKSAFLRKRALRHLRAAVADGIDQLDCVVDATIQTAIQGGTAGVAAFTALRDTVDGKPQAASDDSEAPRISIAIDVIGTVNVGK